MKYNSLCYLIFKTLRAFYIKLLDQDFEQVQNNQACLEKFKTQICLRKNYIDLTHKRIGPVTHKKVKF